MSDIALSYSRLSTFEQCQAKFDYLYVSKTVKDQGNEVSAYGNRVHEVLELYGKDELPTPLGLEAKQTLQKWGGLVDKIKSKKGEKYYEYQMAIDRRRTRRTQGSGQIQANVPADLIQTVPPPPNEP